ncbi:anti-sigma factor [Pseudaminobacter sp. 19-2017]|uniref:Anti-sigma factor n=1 Tax=Pseudaminobacter soli (ex Zhang et al. 2022) TaxID=2831468 RepID=A0A942E074_9HYPH|nr:anti-sigma factor [Pseudaminobacter soli]MBS3650668.1 anti-sigma factor [Pseudaminobacter soli]
MTARSFSERDIHLALDGELPEDERAAYQDWLDSNPEMKARADRFAADMTLLRAALGPIAQEPVPDRLAHIVKGEWPKAPSKTAWWRNAAAAALIFAVGGLAGYFVAGSGMLGGQTEIEERLADQAIDAHNTFTADQAHPVEVAGDNKPYLEAWLSARTGLKLVAPDLTPQGFSLLGGRVVPSDDKPAALLIYKDQDGNRVSIYMMAEGDKKTKGVYTAEEGRPVAVYWSDKGFGCAIVSDLPEERRDEIAAHAWRQIKQGLAA